MTKTLRNISKFVLKVRKMKYSTKIKQRCSSVILLTFNKAVDKMLKKNFRDSRMENTTFEKDFPNCAKMLSL